MNKEFKNLLQTEDESAIVRSTTNYNLNSQRRFLDDSSMTMQRFVADLTVNDQLTGTINQGIESKAFIIEEFSTEQSYPSKATPLKVNQPILTIKSGGEGGEAAHASKQ